jgi:hypothetical protein
MSTPVSGLGQDTAGKVRDCLPIQSAHEPSYCSARFPQSEQLLVTDA